MTERAIFTSKCTKIKFIGRTPTEPTEGAPRTLS